MLGEEVRRMAQTLIPLALAMFVTQLVPAADRARAASGHAVPLLCDAQNTLLVPVSVQGSPARPFLLDTGASVTTIDERTAASLGLASAGAAGLVNAQLIVAGTALPAQSVATGSVKRLAGLVGNVGGILGSDALRALGRTTIDYRGCTLTVGAPPDDPPGPIDAVRVPLEWHQGRPVIAIAGGGRLLLDSGATTMSIFNGTRAAADLRWDSPASSLVRLDRLDGVRVGFLGRLTCVSIGSLALRDVPAVTVQSWYDEADRHAPDGLLPLGLFSRVHLWTMGDTSCCRYAKSADRLHGTRTTDNTDTRPSIALAHPSETAAWPAALTPVRRVPILFPHTSLRQPLSPRGLTGAPHARSDKARRRQPTVS